MRNWEPHSFAPSLLEYVGEAGLGFLGVQLAEEVTRGSVQALHFPA